MGHAKGGPFDIPGNLAREWLRLPANPNGRTNADVLKPWMNGMDLVRRRASWQVDRGFRVGACRIQRRSPLRRAVQVGAGTCLLRCVSGTYGLKLRRKLLVPPHERPPPEACGRALDWPVSLHRNGASRQAPRCSPGATRASVRIQHTDRHRARRRHDVRDLAQPLSREHGRSGSVLAAWGGQRSTLHAEYHDFRDLPVSRPD